MANQTLRERFLTDVMNLGDEPQVVVVAVKLPTGAIETIHNTQFLSDKLAYYINAYDDEFRLKANSSVQIVGYMIV